MINFRSRRFAVALRILIDEIAIYLWSLLFWRMSSVAYHEQIFIRAGWWVARAAEFSPVHRRRQKTLYAIVNRMYQLRPTLDGWSPYLMSLLSVKLAQEFEETGEIQKIDDAIELSQRTIDGALRGYWIPPMKSILWTMLKRRSGEHSSLNSIEQVTTSSVRRQGITFNQNDRAACLNNMGNMLSNRFDCTESIEDLNRAIDLYDEASQASLDDAHRAIPSKNLAGSLLTRHENTGSIEDIHRAIDLTNEMLEFHPHRPSVLHSLGRGLLLRFKRIGSMKDLNCAIEALDEALRSLSVDYPFETSTLLSNLALCLDYRFGRTGSMEDLNRAVDLGHEAVEVSLNKRRRSFSLFLLGISLRHRFDRTGSVKDLNRSIQVNTEALDSTPSKLVRAGILNNLGRGLSNRFKCTGSIEDLESSIELTEKALKIMPLDQPVRNRVLTSLSCSLSTRSAQKGSTEDLNRAIEVQCEALKLIPSNHPDRASDLSFLGGLLVLRHRITASFEDLDHAIQVTKEAMKETQIHQYDRLASLREFKYVLSYQYARDGDTETINRSVEVSNEILELLPLDHADRALWLTGLSVALYNRFRRLRSMEDINRAVQVIDEAIESTPLDVVERVDRLGILGINLDQRYQCTGSITDSDRAIETANEALRVAPSNHPRRTMALLTLGCILIKRLERTKSFDVIEPFLPVFKEAWSCNTAPTSDRIHAAELTAYLLDFKSDWDGSSALMGMAVELLALASPRWLKHADKEHGLKSHDGLASRAVSYALRASKEPYEILKLLELGRGIIAKFLMDLRGDILYVEQQQPSLAADFVSLRDELDKPANEAALWESSNALSLEIEDKRRREADEKLNKVIKEIRAQPELSDFLLPPTEDAFKLAAEFGPIIVINADSFRCDAFLIERHQIRVLNLPDLTIEDVEKRARSLQASRLAASYQTLSTLEWLWDTLAGPCLDALGYRIPVIDNNWPRVWWIPTGPLSHLPLHAAGRHMKGSTDTVLDRVVSSYSTSVKALIYGRRPNSQKAKDPVTPNALLVAMRDTPDLSSLPFAADEIHMLESLSPSLQLKPVSPRQNIRKDVLDHMKRSAIFHFAGHGKSNPIEPSQSCLLLDDWRTSPLTMGDLRDLRLQENSPFLAYLSACSTGENKAERLNDEGISILGACQLAGFRHVVGTLWEVSDRYCVDMARTVYETLRDEGMNDWAVAKGLHHAMRAMRDESIKASHQASNHMGSTSVADSGLNREGRDAKLSTSASRVKKESVNLFWVPYVHYGA